MREPVISESSIELAKVIEEVGPAELSRQTGIHRTQLWRYATGKSRPDADQIAKLHKGTGGRVAADGWLKLIEESVPDSEPRATARRKGAA